MSAVDIWGNVAEWSAALLTGGGVFIASLVYRHDASLRRNAQARKIHVRVADKHDFDRFDIIVTNYSSERIFELRVEFEKLSWESVRYDKFNYGNGEQEAVTKLQIEDTYRVWCKTPSPAIRYAWSEVPWVDVDTSVKIELTTRPNPFQIPSLIFQGIGGDWWRLKNLLAEPQPTLERIRDPENRWWRRLWRSVMRSGKTQYDRTFERQVDEVVKKVKPLIVAETIEASREFREENEVEPRSAGPA